MVAKKKRLCSSGDIECPVCMENIDKTIECPSCKTFACLDCAWTFILTSEMEASCMHCKLVFTMRYINKIFGMTWWRSMYRPFLKNTVCFNRERLLLSSQETLNDIERYKTSELLTSKIAIYDRQVNKYVIHYSEYIKLFDQKLEIPEKTRRLRLKYLDAHDNLQLCIKRNTLLKHELANIRRGVESVEVIKNLYIHRCPLGDCKGFIKTVDMKCILCESKFCKKCLEPKKQKKNGKYKKHTCDQDTIDSVKEMLKDTKPCPNCAVRIQKANGCDHMFCVLCQVGFDWKTGQINKGTISNPEYYEMVRKGLITNVNVPQGVPCGGLVTIFELEHKEMEYVDFMGQSLIEILHERTGECTHNANRLFPTKSNRYYRMSFACGSIDEKRFKSIIISNYITNMLYRNWQHILDAFSTAMIERFRYLTMIKKDVFNTYIKIFKEMVRLIIYTNKSLMEEATLVSRKAVPLIKPDAPLYLVSTVNYIGKNKKPIDSYKDTQKKWREILQDLKNYKSVANIKE